MRVTVIDSPPPRVMRNARVFGPLVEPCVLRSTAVTASQGRVVVASPDCRPTPEGSIWVITPWVVSPFERVRTSSALIVKGGGGPAGFSDGGDAADGEVDRIEARVVPVEGVTIDGDRLAAEVIAGVEVEVERLGGRVGGVDGAGELEAIVPWNNGGLRGCGRDVDAILGDGIDGDAVGVERGVGEGPIGGVEGLRSEEEGGEKNDSHTDQHGPLKSLIPSPSYSGEGVRVRGDFRAAKCAPHPSPLPRVRGRGGQKGYMRLRCLSPKYGGEEGIRGCIRDKAIAQAK